MTTPEIASRFLLILVAVVLSPIFFIDLLLNPEG